MIIHEVEMASTPALQARSLSCGHRVVRRTLRHQSGFAPSWRAQLPTTSTTVSGLQELAFGSVGYD